MASNVAFIGLGVMGYPMAGFLAQAGHQVTVFNRTRAKAERWASEYRGRIAEQPAEAAENADFIFACVGNDDDLREITIGDRGAFASIQSGAVFVDHTTASAVVARELAGHATRLNFDFLDAPVSGGQSGAQEGRLTIMVGGAEAAFKRVAPLLDCYGRMVRRLGASGSGQLAKMVNQICIAGLLQGLAEGLQFAKCADLDVEAVVEVISKGAAQSWQMENRFATMAKGEFDFGFAVQWMRKDLAICLNEANSNGAPLPVTELVDQYYAEVEQMGGSRWDTSSLIARLNPLP